MENKNDSNVFAESQTQVDSTRVIIESLIHQGMKKEDVTDIITPLSTSPAITAFHTLIQYCIKHIPTDANIQLDPVTEDELKIVEERLGYTLFHDLRAIYLIHRNALCDHSFSRTELIPRFSTLSNPDIRANDYDYKEISPDVVQYDEESEQNTWKLYHCKYGCIMQYWYLACSEEPDMDYLPRVLWFSVTHLLLSYVSMIQTFAPYWWDDQKYDTKDSIKYREWEEKQRQIICQSEDGRYYDMCIYDEIMERQHFEDDEISWECVIDEYLQEKIQYVANINNTKSYLISWRADKWTQQHPIYDLSWESERDRRSEFRKAKREAINYTED